MARILVVDDSPTELHILKNFLEARHHEVITASNGEEGLDKAKKEKPNLILMDIVMPGMNGYETTRKISNDPETASIPVIIVSSKNQATDRVWGLRQGANEYVFKPIDEQELDQKVKTLLGMVA